MFFGKIFAYMEKKQYFCIVFFMVLDLRLMEIGLSGDNPSFFLLMFSRSLSMFYRCFTDILSMFYQCLHEVLCWLPKASAL